MLYFKPFDQIQISDVEQLKNDEVTEGKFLDYKLEPPSPDSKAFLETAIAFANSQGGVVVYGVKELRVGNEKTGKIEEVCGFESSAIDSIKGRLENQIRDSVQPRIEYRMKELPLPNGKYVLLLRVNQGWQGPYSYRHQRGLYFYRRAESQNVLMDNSEIKTHFLSSDTLRDKLKSFHLNRVQDIITQQMPFNMEGEKIFTAHVLPLDSFKDSTTFSQQAIAQYVASVGPLSSQGYSSRPNIDGVFQYWSSGQSDHTKPVSYVQYFRNGVVEYGDSMILTNVSGPDRMHIKAFGTKFNPAVRRAIAYQKSLGLNGPFFLGVSLWNVNGTKVMQGNDPWDNDEQMRFDRHHVHLPIFEIEDASATEHTLTRPILDMLCNAAGWDKCMRYDHNGDWS